jgi:tRNA (adenine37-N6)-methyltransferase
MLVADYVHRGFERYTAALATAPDVFSGAFEPAGEQPALVIRSARPGAIQALDVRGLAGWAREHECLVVICHQVGDFVAAGANAELEATPIQAGLNRAERGTIEIADRYQDGLDGLAEFDYAWLMTWLHRLAEPGSDPPLRHVPFLLRSQQRSRGIFATRGPKRINPIGLSLIQVLDVTGPTIRFAGVDLVDGTPVIDLKPYVTRFDRPAGETPMRLVRSGNDH